MKSSPFSQPPLWRQIQRTNFTRLDELCSFLQLDSETKNKLHASPHFVLNLPRRLAEKIAKGTLDDPIARQFLPLKEELVVSQACVSNPVKDELFQLGGRLLQKYKARALLIATGACAVHCRYCFRQNYDYPERKGDFQKELDLLKQNPHIDEVILSGGDPLSLDNETLIELMNSLSPIGHIKRLRIHTRFPIGIPERIDQALLKATEKLSIPLWVVVHVNHARELDSDVLTALQAWRNHGALLLNQSVLLKGVNDNLETLHELCSTLINHGIAPYYLHRLDRVKGAAHFDVPLEVGKELIHKLQGLLPGYGVPRFVQEIPGEDSKTLL